LHDPAPFFFGLTPIKNHPGTVEASVFSKMHPVNELFISRDLLARGKSCMGQSKK
jgi:hypothetical protein